MTNRKISEQLTLTLYESIKEMPASLHQKARQYEVMDSELGTNAADLEQMLVRAEQLGVAGQKQQMAEQLYNYKLARRLARSGYQPGHLEWACYVAAANGIPISDYSEESLEELILEWSGKGLTHKHIEELLETVKKK